MPKLEYLMKGMQGVQNDLDEADHVKSNMDSMLEKRFSEINRTIEASLKDLVRNAGDGQVAAFNSAIQQAMLQLTQTQQILLNSLNRIANNGKKYKEEICKDIDMLAKDLGKQNASLEKGLSTEIKNATAEINKSIQAIPEPPKTDLSPVTKGIANISKQIKAIPKTEIPEQKDFTDAFKSLEKKIENRTHVFTVERESFSDLIKTIKVTSK